MLNRHPVPTVRLALLLPVVLAFAACGGGNDAPNAPESLQLLMRRGDTMPGGLVVNSVESARMSADGTVTVIASRSGTPSVNGVYVRRPSGQYERILDESSPEAQGLTLTTVGQLLEAPTGEAVFKEGGNQIDRETVFYWQNGQLTRLAGASDPKTPDGFRKLGELRLGPGGVVAFTYGLDGEEPCTVDSSTGTERIECKLRLVQGFPGALSEVTLPNSLESQRPTAVGLEYNAAGDLVVGLPASGRNPLVGIVRNGVFTSVIERQAEFEQFGRLLAATPRAIATNGDLLIDAGFDTDGDNVRDDERILLYSGGGFTSITELGEPAGTKVIVDVRGLSIDDQGRATYQIHFNDPDQSTGPISLRQWQNGAVREIAFEGQCCFGEDEEGNEYRILEIQSIRSNRAGDVVFIARIGFIEDGTEETVERRLFRDSGGGLETVLRTGSEFSGGTIAGIETLSDINDRGDLLLIVELRGAGRALVLIPR